jgi:hypothetical protein
VGLWIFHRVGSAGWFDASNNNDGSGPYGGYCSTPMKDKILE